jgi:hypothetical protein
MRKNLINCNDNEEIVFVSNIDNNDETKYLILSNYRILYSFNKLSSFNEIHLYQI